MLKEFRYIYNLKKLNQKRVNEYSKIDLLSFVVDTHKKMYNEKFVLKSFHEEMCDLLTKCALRKLDGYTAIINMPPRYSKTQVMIYYVMWCFLKNEMARFIYATYSQKLSLKISREVKNGLVRIYGMKSSLSKDSAELWETNAGGGFWAATIGGSVTGFGAGDLYATPFGGDLIIDDPQKPIDAFYETQRQNVIENYSQTFWSRRNNQDKIPIINVQQRLNVNDLSGWLLKESKYRITHLIIKAIDENGQPTFPEKVSLETLKELKDSSPFTFAAQQQQDPKDYVGEFFKLEMTRVMPVSEFKEKEWLMKFFVRSWDLAGVKKEQRLKQNSNENKRDFTRGVLMCTDGEFIYIMDLKSHRGTVDLNDSLIVQTAHTDGEKVMITIPEDPGVGGQHYVSYLQSLPELHGFSLHPVPPTQNKRLRAAPFASFLNRGKVIIVSDEEDEIKWNHILFDELASFPHGVHDDIVDACSDCIFEIHQVNKFIS